MPVRYVLVITRNVDNIVISLQQRFWRKANGAESELQCENSLGPGSQTEKVCRVTRVIFRITQEMQESEIKIYAIFYLAEL